MAVHDPESSAQEKALALKLGRQKKIQVSTNNLLCKLQNRDVYSSANKHKQKITSEDH